MRREKNSYDLTLIWIFRVMQPLGRTKKWRNQEVKEKDTMETKNDSLETDVWFRFYKLIMEVSMLFSPISRQPAKSLDTNIVRE